jgi:hypothetical protein
MKALISRPQNGPISDPDETLHEPKKDLLSKDNGFLDEASGSDVLRGTTAAGKFQRTLT